MNELNGPNYNKVNDQFKEKKKKTLLVNKLKEMD